MQPNTPAVPRRFNRQSVAMPIGLVLKADHFKPDDSAITVNISQHGASVRTKLALVPGQWVGFVAKGESPRAIPTRVVWVRRDESSDFTVAGLQFLGALEA